MDAQSTPATPPEQPQAPHKPTAYEVRNQYLEYLVLTLWAFAMFYFDGWRNPEIHATGFNKSVAVLLAGYSIFCLIMFVSAQFNISRQPPVTPDPQEVRSRFLWMLAKFLGLLIWFLQDRSAPERTIGLFGRAWLAFGIIAILYCGYVALRTHLLLLEQQPSEPPPDGPANTN